MSSTVRSLQVALRGLVPYAVSVFTILEVVACATQRRDTAKRDVLYCRPDVV